MAEQNSSFEINFPFTNHEGKHLRIQAMVTPEVIDSITQYHLAIDGQAIYSIVHAFGDEGELHWEGACTKGSKHPDWEKEALFIEAAGEGIEDYFAARDK